MKSIAVPLLAVALASTLAACTPPDDAQKAVAQPAPVAEAPAVEAPTKPAAPTVPVLRELTEAERAESLVAATNCNIESAADASFAGADITLATPTAAKVTGWLRADRAGSAIEQPVLRIEAADKSRLWESPVHATIARDDLPSADAETGTPGFEAVFDAGALPPGRYHLYLGYRADGVLIGCDNGRHIVIL